MNFVSILFFTIKFFKFFSSLLTNINFIFNVSDPNFTKKLAVILSMLSSLIFDTIILFFAGSKNIIFSSFVSIGFV